MKIIFLAFGVLFQYLLEGQDYFSKYYTFDSGTSNFRTLLVDHDTILLEGIFVDTIAPFLQGIVFAKVDSSGNLISNQRYFDPKGRDLTYPPLNNMTKLSDGRYLVPAMTFQDNALLLIFLNSQFRVDTVFEYFAGEATVRLNLIRSVFELNDGYIIFGSAQRLSYATDGQIFRIKKNGDLIWRQWYGLANKDEAFGDVALYMDSTFIVASFHKPFPVTSQNHLYNTWIFEIDLDGNILNEYADSDPYSGPSGGLVIDNNKNIFYSGSKIIDGMYGQQNGLGRIGMLNSEFMLQWKTTFGENQYILTEFIDMILSGSRLITVGSQVDTARTDSGFLNQYTTGWTGVTNIYGDSICERFDTATWYPHEGRAMGFFRAMDTLSSGNIIACGDGWFGPQDDYHEFAWLKKMQNPPCENLITKNEEPPENISSSLQINPNPARNLAVIQWPEETGDKADHLLVFDQDGRCMRKLILQIGSKEISLNLTGFVPGTYIVQLNSKEGYLLGLEKLIVAQ